MHFTDDINKIPERFRSQTKKQPHFLIPTPEQLKEEESKEEKMRKEKERCKECEIVAFSTFERGIGEGATIGSSSGSSSSWGFRDTHSQSQSQSRGYYWERKETCAEVTIQNNSCEEKEITEKNIMARSGGGKVFPRNDLRISLKPGQWQKQSVCFGELLPQIKEMFLEW